MNISVTSPNSLWKIEDLDIKSWPIETCNPSTFPWEYSEKENCLILEGNLTVTPDGGEPVRFGVGDLVVFPKGFLALGKCTKQFKSTIVLAINQ